MRLLLSAGIMLLSASSVQAEPATPQGMRQLGIEKNAAGCPPLSRFHASQNASRIAPRQLTESPAADAYRAVLRSDGRCQVPVIVKYHVGGR